MRISIVLLVTLAQVFTFASCKKQKPTQKPEIIQPEIIVEPVEIETYDFDFQNIGYKIWGNEDSKRNKDNLISWNQGEDFLSCGIGHFTWNNQLTNSTFEQSFPKFINFVQEKYPTLDIPEFLTLKYSPWDDRELFYQDKRNKSTLTSQFIEFLYSTIDLQSEYFLVNFDNFYPEIVKLSSDPTKTQNTIKELLKSENGAYALIDYLNFKGSGTKENEQFNGEKWGLLQVLENMEEPSIQSFKDSAIEVLNRRVQNNPSDSKWIRGWVNRINTY